jgi:hypothetical protein
LIRGESNFDDKYVVKSVQLVRGSSFRNDLLQIRYFKVGKNSFVWNGFKNMTQILAFLRYIALCQNLDKAIMETREKEASKLGKKIFYETKKPVQKVRKVVIVGMACQLPSS